MKVDDYIAFLKDIDQNRPFVYPTIDTKVFREMIRQLDDYEKQNVRLTDLENWVLRGLPARNLTVKDCE